MRLSKEKARQLSRMVWRDRMRRALPIVLAVVVLGAGATYFFLQQMSTPIAPSTEDARRQVVTVKKSGAAAATAIVKLMLDDGRESMTSAHAVVRPRRPRPSARRATHRAS